jgi:selT/selW/selH-like putative selenoprotein
VAAELERSLGVKSKLIKGSGGIFDVVVDGVRVFSKHESDRFPNPGEVTDLIRGG